MQASDGNFYETTGGGGTVNCYDGACGTVFKITPEGTLTTLHSFQGYPTDGEAPFGALIQATDGNFYGTTSQGGAYVGYIGGGTVFKVTPSGTLTTLYSFCAQYGCPDDIQPEAALVQATDGNFYGTTVRVGQRLLRVWPQWLWHALQNHPRRHADHAVQFLRSTQLY